MALTFGCNTLYPCGRLSGAVEAFDVGAQRRALRTIREAGLDGCEFSHYQHLAPADQEKLRGICSCMGLTPWSAHSWQVLPAAPEQVDSALPGLRTSLAGAARLGVRVLVVHAAGCIPEGYPGRATALARSLRAMSLLAQSAGITVAVENCGDRTDLEFLADTLDQLDLPAIGFNIDTGHAVLGGMDPAQAIWIMGKRLVTTHLQDNFGQRDDHLPPGRGTIAWDTVRDALRQVGYGGMLMVEISDCPPGREPDPVEETRAAADFLKTLFGADRGSSQA
jgi:sugar phosphate isomerase/epimerase